MINIENKSFLFWILPEINKPRKREALKNQDLSINQETLFLMFSMC
jgi:hypothetical protein